MPEQEGHWFLEQVLAENTYSLPGTVLDVGSMEMLKIDKVPVVLELVEERQSTVT